MEAKEFVKGASKRASGGGNSSRRQRTNSRPRRHLLLFLARATLRWRQSSKSGSATFRNGKTCFSSSFFPLPWVPCFFCLTFFLALPPPLPPPPLSLSFHSTPINNSYTSNVTLTPPSTVLTTASGSSLFRHLDCRWRFSEGPLPQRTTWVSFSISFEFKSAVHRHLASVFFDDVVRKMVVAFEGRCADLYGAPSVERRRRVVVPSSAVASAAAATEEESEEERGKLPA